MGWVEKSKRGVEILIRSITGKIGDYDRRSKFVILPL